MKSINDFQLGVSPDAWENLLTYLKEKNFSESEMLDAGLIMKNEEGRTRDRFHNRLMFPIRDARAALRLFPAGSRMVPSPNT